MTQEEKKLLLKDICARLPYSLMYRYTRNAKYAENCNFDDFDSDLHSIMDYILGEAEYIKPYLRPMSSMTEEERKEYFLTWEEEPLERRVRIPSISTNDWLNEHHFDYRGLIEKGLALEAPKDMYKTE